MKGTHPNRVSVITGELGISNALLGQLLGRTKSGAQKYLDQAVDIPASVLLRMAELFFLRPEDFFREAPAAIVNRAAEHRINAGLSQEDVTGRLGWPLWRVRAVERATAFPPPDAGLALAELLDAPLSALFFDLADTTAQTKLMAAMIDGLSDGDRAALFRHADALSKSSVTRRKDGTG